MLAAAGLAGPRGAEERGAAALEVAEALGGRSGVARAWDHLGASSLGSGRLQEAVDRWHRALALYVDPFDRPWRAMTLNLLALAELQSGELACARELALEAVAVSSLHGEVWVLAMALNCLAAVHRASGNLDEAGLSCVRSFERAEELGDVVGANEALIGLAGVCVARGHAREAAMLFGAAEAVREGAGLRLDDLMAPARYEADLAAARRDLGDGALVTAWSQGRDLPRRGLHAEAEAVLAGLAGPPTPVRSSSTARDGGLTPREVEVLRLVVEGRTDREIGQILFNGHRTVASHVSNILGKLGVESRAAAAVQAVRRGLV